MLKSHGYNSSHVMQKIFLANICFQKQNGRHIQIRLIYAFVNVHYVYVTSLIFDVIGCLKFKHNRAIIIEIL